MEFSPRNPVVQLCLQGMGLEAAGRKPEAVRIFQQAWADASQDHEKFLSAYFLARSHVQVADRITWFDTALTIARGIDDDSVRCAYPLLHTRLAECHEALGDSGQAARSRELASTCDGTPRDPGPFYHGTKAELRIGDRLSPGHASNYRDDLTMRHVYFTALASGAGLAAELAKGDGRARVYVVQPTGPFEHDPNVTNMKFPGNPTRSYRSRDPVIVTGELADWTRQTPEELKAWRDKLASAKGAIIN